MLLLTIIGVMFSCSDGDDNRSQTIDMRINHYQSTGVAMGPVLTLLVQQGDALGTKDWNKFYSNIEGFVYVPGKIYNISVKVEHIDTPPADGSSLKYTLLEVKSIQDVDEDTLFEIHLKMNGQNFVTKNGGYKLLDQIDIDCNTMCEQLAATLERQAVVTGTFKRISNDTLQLVELK